METKNPTEMVCKELEWLQANNYFAVPPHSPGGGGLFLSYHGGGRDTRIWCCAGLTDLLAIVSGLSYSHRAETSI